MLTLSSNTTEPKAPKKKAAGTKKKGIKAEPYASEEDGEDSPLMELEDEMDGARGEESNVTAHNTLQAAPNVYTHEGFDDSSYMPSPFKVPFGASVSSGVDVHHSALWDLSTNMDDAAHMAMSLDRYDRVR